MSVTLHRAFDVCVDPMRNYGTGNLTGNRYDPYFRTAQCMSAGSRSFLKELEKKSQGRITIQAGSGVGAEVIRQLYPLTGIKAYHMSGKVVTDSAMQFRKEGVNMGLPTFSEYEIWRTDIENIRAAKKVLEEL